MKVSLKAVSETANLFIYVIWTVNLCYIFSNVWNQFGLNKTNQKWTKKQCCILRLTNTDFLGVCEDYPKCVFILKLIPSGFKIRFYVQAVGKYYRQRYTCRFLYLKNITWRIFTNDVELLASRHANTFCT